MYIQVLFVDISQGKFYGKGLTIISTHVFRSLVSFCSHIECNDIKHLLPGTRMKHQTKLLFIRMDRRFSSARSIRVSACLFLPITRTSVATPIFLSLLFQYTVCSKYAKVDSQRAVGFYLIFSTVRKWCVRISF